jgi:hypothetical protein
VLLRAREVEERATTDWVGAGSLDIYAPLSSTNATENRAQTGNHFIEVCRDETLTRVWLILVADARRRTAAEDSRVLLAAAPELWDRALPLRHYSKSLLFGKQARATFVEPDLAPLPVFESRQRSAPPARETK